MVKKTTNVNYASLTPPPNTWVYKKECEHFWMPASYREFKIPYSTYTVGGFYCAKCLERKDG